MSEHFKRNEDGLIATGEKLQSEETVTTKNGVSTFLTELFPLNDQSGKMYAICGINFDITEKKKAEEQITYLASLAEQTSDAIISTDLDFIIKTWNDGAQKMYGYSKEEAIGISSQELLKTDISVEERKAIREEIFKNGSWKGELIQKHKSGKTIYVISSFSVIKNSSGEQIGTVRISTDITAQKLLNLQLEKFNSELETQVQEKTTEIKNILDHISDGFSAFDRNWTNIYTNKKAGELLHRDPAELIGTNFWDNHPEIKGQPIENALLTAMNDQQYIHLEYYYEPFERWYENHFYPTGNGLTIIFRDITKKKKAEEELKLSSSLLKATLESTDDGILVVDNNGKFSGYNNRFVKMWNIPDDIMSERDDQKAITFAMDQLKEPKCFSARIKELYDHPEETSFDIFELKDGRTFERYSQPQRMNDEIAGRVWSFRDITERKKAEVEIKKIAEQLSEVSSSVPGAVYQFKLDAAGKMSFNFMSEGIFELSGYKPEKFYEDAMQVFSLVQQDDLPGMFQSIESSANTLQPWFYIFKIKDQNGEDKWIRGNSIPHKLTNGDIIWNGTLIDITDLKVSEEQLKASELRYRSLIEQASDAIMVTDFNGNFIDVNEKMCRMFGYSKSELLQMNIETLIDPEQLKTEPIVFARLSKGEHVYSERRMIDKNGKIIDVEANVKKLGTDMVLAIARDVTEKRKIAQEIKESEERYRSLIEQASDAIMVTDFNGNFIDGNESMCRMFGYTKKELLGMNVERLLDPVQSKTRPMYYDDLIQGKHEFSERRMMDKSGRTLDVEANVKKIGDNMLLAIARDVTDRKKIAQEIKISEERFRTLYEENPLMNFTIDADGKIISVNKQGAFELGYSVDELIGKSLLHVFNDEDHRTVLDQLKECLSNPKKTFTWNLRKLTKTGETIWVSETGTALMDENGNYFVMIVCKNITERKKAEKEMQQMNKQLRNLSSHLQSVREEERTSIAREIHDELGQQLTGLKMDASWLLKKIPSEEKNMHDKISGMIKLLDSTVNTVRRISTELRPGILDDLGLIDALDWQSNEFEKRTGIHCEFKSSPAESQFEKNLSTGIFRVYQETLTNVARHSNATSIKTTFELSGDNIILKVQDNGNGFDEDAVRKKNTLGIIGMKERATMFGGKLSIESSIGKGTVIHLQVPMKIVQDKTEA